jgi:hypothetical protein
MDIKNEEKQNWERSKAPLVFIEDRTKAEIVIVVAKGEIVGIKNVADSFEERNDYAKPIKA